MYIYTNTKVAEWLITLIVRVDDFIGKYRGRKREKKIKRNFNKFRDPWNKLEVDTRVLRDYHYDYRTSNNPPLPREKPGNWSFEGPHFKNNTLDNQLVK